jgi:hypothetical protein
VNKETLLKSIDNIEKIKTHNSWFKDI